MHKMAIKKATKTLQRSSNRLALAIILLIFVCLGSCQPKHTDFTEFRHIPSCGWLKSAPLHFTPVLADSAHTYTLSIAVRHSNEYAFSNASLTVDLIGTDTIVNRKRVNLRLADDAGNWLGSGFGALYQVRSTLCTGIRAGEVTKIVVWQGLDTDTLSHITEVGIILD